MNKNTESDSEMMTPDKIVELIDDLIVVLRTEKMIPMFSDEGNPVDIEFVYDPPAENPPVDTSNIEEPEQKPIRKQAANARCTLCENRIYPVKRYKRDGKYPILFLHYSGAVNSKEQRIDRTDRFRLGTAEEDDFFARMLQAASFGVDDFYFQEYPACHFNFDRSTNDDWNSRGSHCLGHVIETIKQEEIELVVLMGFSAVLLLGEEIATKMASSGEIMPLTYGDYTVQTLVSRSPRAVLTLEKKRKRQEQSGDQESYKKYKKQESAIKKQMLSAFEKASGKYKA